MSSQRGNSAKSGSQKHQNTKAYRNNLHRKDKTIKILNSLQITGCCKRCKEVIEWKIKYNKYKALTHPKKCVKCLQKSVTNSYFIICLDCIESRNLCGKCALVPPAESPAEATEAVETEINSQSEGVSTERKPANKNDDSDCDEDDSVLSDEVKQVVRIRDKPSDARTEEVAKNKNTNKHKDFEKRKVSFRTSESGSESEPESEEGEEEEVVSGYEDETKDDRNEYTPDDEDKGKLSEDENRDDVNKLSVKVDNVEDGRSKDDDNDEEEGEDEKDD